MSNSRTKKVFSDSSMVAHLWAHQEQEEARNSSNTFYFNGKSIYSYGSHFEIARIIEEAVVMFTTRKYSSTTAKHIAYTRGAIPNSFKIIRVPHLHNLIDKKKSYLDIAISKNLKWFFEEVEELVNKQLKAKKVSYIPEIKNKVIELKEYADYFKLPKSELKPYKFLIELDLSQEENLTELLKEKYGVIHNKNLKERQAKERKLKKEQEVKIKEWLEGYHSKDAIYTLTGDKILLRLIEKPITEDFNVPRFVQTSKGIEVSAEKAIKLYDGICRIRQSVVSEEAIDKLIDKFELRTIDNWTINKITPEGDLIAGCHRIHFSEIDRFATKAGWKNNAK